MYLWCLSMRFRKSCQVGKIFVRHHESGDFHEKLTFLENAQEASMKLLICLKTGHECLESAGDRLRVFKFEQEISKISTFFMLVHVFGCSAV